MNSSIDIDELLKIVLDSIPTPVYVKGTDGKYLYCNKAMGEMFGCEPSEMLGKDSLSAIGDSTQMKSFVDVDRKLLADSDVSGLVEEMFDEVALSDARGDHVRVQYKKSTFFSEDRVAGVIGTTFDVTALRDSEKYYATMFKIANAVSSASDLNDLFLQIQLVLQEYVQADNFYVALLGEDRRTLSCKFWANEKNVPNNIKRFRFTNRKRLSFAPVIRKAPYVVTREEILRKESAGELIHSGNMPEVWVGLPLIVKGEVIGMMAIQSYHDKFSYSQKMIDLCFAVSGQIAQAICRKQLEEAWLKEKKRAENASAAKSEFLANMSHEIRTPMGGVMGLLNMLSETSLNKTQSAMLSSAQKSAESMMVVLNDILDLSKVEAGKMSLERMAVDLTELLQDTVSLYRPGAVAKEIGLRLSITEDIPLVWCDPTRLKQVLGNLLSNAVKFTKDGMVHLNAVSRWVDPSTVQILFEVVDTGIGIPDDKQSIVFDSFSQADDSTTREYGGTGLGLPLARKIVNEMGSTLNLYSKYGAGSRFYFEVEFEVREFPNEKDPEISYGDMETLAILVAEDNSVNIMIAKMMLEKAGHHVIRAKNGAEALSLFERQKFDIIFMDINMPIMDGYEAAGRIRKMESRSSRVVRTPIVALTANIFKDNMDRALSCGMDDYLTKPFSKENLLHVLWETLPSKRIGNLSVA